MRRLITALAVTTAAVLLPAAALASPGPVAHHADHPASPAAAVLGHAASKPYVLSASTAITNRPDSGNFGTWATDNFTRKTTVTLVGQVSVSNCPGSTTGQCWLWTFKISDAGHFTTIPGDLSPEGSVPLEVAVTGTMTGGTSTGEFYGSFRFGGDKRMPATEDDHGTVPSGRHATTNWAEQFFGAGAVFNSTANPGGPDLNKWSWEYTAAFGSDASCPHAASQWVDSYVNSGSTSFYGDITAPAC